MGIKDPKRRRAYARAYHARRKDDPRYKATLKAQRVRGKVAGQKVFDEWRANGCVLCGETSLCCLHAHHINPDEKLCNVAEAVANRMGPRKIKDELEKCVCLCANCHYKLHAGEVTL